MIVLIFVVLIAFVSLLNKYCYSRMPKVLKHTLDSVKAFLMWDKVLTWTTETYQSMAIGALFAVKSLSSSSSTAFKIVIPLQIVYLTLWPAVIFWILYRNRAQLSHNKIRESIGSLYMQFDTEKQSCIHFTMFFLYRRLIFAFIINIVDQYVVLQLALFSFIGLALLAYILIWQPMESTLFNALAFFNESISVVLGCQLYLFTGYVPEPEMRFIIGKRLLGLVYFDIAVNLVVLVAEVSFRTITWLKRYLILRKRRIAADKINQIK